MTIQTITTFEGTAEVGANVRPFRYDSAARELTIGDLDADQAVLLLRAIGRGESTVAPGIGTGQDEVVVAAAAKAAADRAGAPAASSSERVKVGGPDHGKPASSSDAKAAGRTEAKPADPPAEKPADPPAETKAPAKPAAPAPAPAETKAPAKKRGSSKAPAKGANVRDDMSVAADPEATEAPPVETAPEKTAAKAPETPQDAPKAAPPTEGSSGGNGLPEELVGAKKLRDVVSYFFDSGITDPEEIVARCVEVKDGVKVLARIKNVEDRVRRALDVLGLAG